MGFYITHFYDTNRITNISYYVGYLRHAAADGHLFPTIYPFGGLGLSSPDRL